MDLPTFLAWFTGYSENIKQKPTAQQWKRICDEIRKIEAPIAVAAPAARQTAQQPAAPVKQVKAAPTTNAQWLAQYKEALMDEHGMDPESAKELAADAVVDLNRDPALSARADLADMTRN